jgi:hypothetical protein
VDRKVVLSSNPMLLNQYLFVGGLQLVRGNACWSFISEQAATRKLPSGNLPHRASTSSPNGLAANEGGVPLTHAQSRSRHQPNDHTQRGQNRDKVDRGRAAGMRGQVSGKEHLISRAQSYQEEHTLSQHQP